MEYVQTQYTTAMKRYRAKGRTSRLLTTWAALVRSMKPMMEASDVSLKRTMNWVTSEGIMFLRAWGRITNTMVWVPVRPTAVAASACPRGTDWTPARTISPRYAASKITKAVRATQNSGMGRRNTMGTTNHIQKITMTRGTPRKNST